jgi:glutathione reductase (NADPH)
MTTPFDFDLLVIGAGSGGLAAAERTGSYGARVAIVEAAKTGGACVNYGCIPVDDWSQTTCSSIFAVGDCTGRMPLTPSAIAQARAFADAQFGDQWHSADLNWMPMSVSSHAEAATIGLSEAEAGAMIFIVITPALLHC